MQLPSFLFLKNVRIGFLSFLASLCFPFFSIAQISSGTAVSLGPTAYTNGSPNDLIFYYCAGQLGELTAAAPGGTPNWNFTWQKFDAPTNSWVPFTIQNGVLASTISNLQPAGYRVTIVDSNGVTVGTFIAWVVQITTNPSVNVTPIAPGCSNVTLNGSIIYGSMTPYYNPPTGVVDPLSAMIIDANTLITVCFTGNHTFVSDLGFHLIGPPSCGSPDIVLAPNPGTNCNTGDNFSNLCFSNNSFTNFNVCGAAVPLSGTYGSYGAGNTPINWAALYGCDATAPGWILQVWDCVGGDSGTLTSASVTFMGTTLGGSPSTVTYNSGAISSAIGVVSCSQSVAASYTVSSTAAIPLTCTPGFIWTATPAFTIPNATTSLTTVLNPGPTVTTTFTLTLTGNCVDATCGGTTSDSETFIYTPPAQAVITPAGPFCDTDPAVTLQASLPGGTWGGPGITNAAAGTFTPSSAAIGNNTISYTINQGCSSGSTSVVNVLQTVNPVITDPGIICVSDPSFNLQITNSGGTWSGPGITDAALGTFSPSAAGVGTYTIIYSMAGVCNGQASLPVTVVSPLNPIITAPVELCIGEGIQNLTVTANGGTWAGPGIIDTSLGTFDPMVAGVGNQAITYSVDNGCAVTSNASISVTDVVDATVTDVAPICETAAPFQLYAYSPGGIWSGPGITDAVNGIFDPSAAGGGSHSIIYEITGACYGIDQTVIDVTPYLVPQITDPGEFCVNDASQNLQVDLSSGVWSGSGITSIVNGTFNPTIAGAGTHTISYAVGGLCPTTGTFDVVVNALPVLNLGPDVEICTYEQATLDAGAGWVSVNWSNGTAAQSINVNVAGPYTATVTDGNGCQGTDQVILSLVNLPNINLGPDFDICQGTPQTITAGQVGLWSNGQTALSISAATAGTYWFRYTQSGCIASDTVNVGVVVPPIVELGPDQTICPGEIVTLTIPLNGQWNTGVTADYLDISSTGNYLVNVVLGPCLVNDQMHLQVLDLPIANIPATTTWCTDQELVINAFNPVNTSYLWSTGETTPSIAVTTTGDYIVVASNQCGDAAAMSSVYFTDCTYAIYIPNTFTPDGDGINEAWRPEVYNLRLYELFVFNRWGELVFHSTDPEEYWTGGSLGSGYFVEDGLYSYRLKYTTNLGEAGNEKGNVLVIR